MRLLSKPINWVVLTLAIGSVTGIVSAVLGKVRGDPFLLHIAKYSLVVTVAVAIVPVGAAIVVLCVDAFRRK